MTDTPRRERIIQIVGGSVILLVCTGFILWGLSIFDSIVNEPPYHYEEADVQAVCDLFQLDNSDRFCADPAVQGPGSLESMLERNFPLHDAEYWNIMPHIGSLSMRPVACFEGDESRLDFCPPPTDCGGTSTYTCGISFPGEIGLVTIDFSKRSEVITRYGVERQPGS